MAAKYGSPYVYSDCQRTLHCAIRILQRIVANLCVRYWGETVDIELRMC